MTPEERQRERALITTKAKLVTHAMDCHGCRCPSVVDLTAIWIVWPDMDYIRAYAWLLN